MTMLSVAPKSAYDSRIADVLGPFQRRIEAMPPGTCPIAVQLVLLETGGAQTCGKCVPCRDGIPQLAALMRSVLNCEADECTLDTMRQLAQMIKDTSDCAIGYEAGKMALEGLDAFAEEYRSHVQNKMCAEGVGQTVPCETKCPAHVNIPAYIGLVLEGDCEGAVKMIRKDNPWPTACALICEHPCEARCRRTLIDAPLNIRGIKKYAVDNAPADTVPVPKRLPDSGRKVAVVGGGPSGLTCAYYLALMGHQVTVYEGRKKLGGMMRYGIPAYRFPRERIDQDIRAILSVGGIDVRYETIIDDVEMARLSYDYDAIYVAVGAQGGKSLKIDGVDANGVMSAVQLLERIGDGDYPDFSGKKVVVIGGGNVAMDCARTSVRAGAEEVTVAYRRRIEDMTALHEEIEGAMSEGVEFMTLQSPLRIEKDEDGNVAALICQPQYIGAVKRGRPAPVDANKPTVRLEADIILIAVGQDIHSAPFEKFGMKAERTRFVADENLRAEGFKNIFVGGDCQTGPKSAIMAIGAGKVAARNIDEYLGFHHKLDPEVEVPKARPNVREAYGRVNIVERPARERGRDFDHIEIPLCEEEVMQECSRCLRCDAFGCGVLEGGRVQYV
ncbi:Glutamate synthase [NADPH] small chain [Slackia heliotrinireducens]|uniref:NADPH-dependent glutamate synthase beta chain-like oxidoreductase n=2 Tax=Slackia TaxID=84108 RepID=C7N2M8_SLAHD|nr:NADPH-dependent glutamate synthase beta chain-like oxidoreductase [Slackia heliotrinireducens DSM 20476]VEH02942.1 Glutamate synthase [NADPH] small chain [Slackia heliotrinireducens]